MDKAVTTKGRPADKADKELNNLQPLRKPAVMEQAAEEEAAAAVTHPAAVGELDLLAITSFPAQTAAAHPAEQAAEALALLKELLTPVTAHNLDRHLSSLATFLTLLHRLAFLHRRQLLTLAKPTLI